MPPGLSGPLVCASSAHQYLHYSVLLSSLADTLCCCCCSRDFEANNSADDCIAENNYQLERTLLIFVNPRSGAGRSLKIFKKRVLPQLNKIGIKFDLLLTEYQNHARSYLSSLEDFSVYNALLIVSGDGLVFEVFLQFIVNALFERSDCPNLPIAIIPTGSGNGLLASVFYYRQLSLKNSGFLKQAIRNVCNSNAMAYPVNIMHVETPSKSYAAAISVGFGLFADIDIESEKWRRTLGSARFTAGALVRFLKLRTYQCRLSFCQCVEDSGNTKSCQTTLKPFRIYPTSEWQKSDCKQSRAAAEITCSNANLQRHLQKSQFQDVPKITEQVPLNWTTIEDEFIFIYALAISHAGQDIPYIPEAQLFDRKLYLTYGLKKDLQNRLDLLKFLSDIKNAKHMKYSFFKTVPVTSFRIEIFEKPKAGGYVTIDGELVDCDVLQATNTSSSIFIAG
uniref:DAGKc domain-containing protein n=1 Tax=Syphacia muris TaxID=451379 RepID=A0A0N5AR21_9BILA